ncbi:MAG TPA: helix-turn-helix domain-containing protein, partial [Ilumatobacteraceae bacterium]|nr:helix-turn-helix domain-containing protein [Ilumatobacteraceae bacterium]
MDPRVERTRTAVLRAATNLLVEGGPSAVTIDAIVAQSGVAKSTIYRHWDSRDEVLAAVVDAAVPSFPALDPDAPVIDQLAMVVATTVAALNDPEWARVLPALFLLKHHADGIRAIDDRIEREQDSLVLALLQRGMDEGLLTPGVE